MTPGVRVQGGHDAARGARPVGEELAGARVEEGEAGLLR
jgi:hypothetical protein